MYNPLPLFTALKRLLLLASRTTEQNSLRKTWKEFQQVTKKMGKFEGNLKKPRSLSHSKENYSLALATLSMGATAISITIPYVAVGVALANHQ